MRARHDVPSTSPASSPGTARRVRTASNSSARPAKTSSWAGSSLKVSRLKCIWGSDTASAVIATSAHSGRPVRRLPKAKTASSAKPETTALAHSSACVPPIQDATASTWGSRCRKLGRTTSSPS